MSTKHWILILACAASTPSRAADNWLEQAQSGIAASAYAAAPDPLGFRAANPTQELRANFRADGLAVSSPTGEAVNVSLHAWGRPGSLTTAAAVPPEAGPCQSDGAFDALGNCLTRVQYARPGVTEWWENRPEGLEHGFTVAEPPAGNGPLVFEVDIGGATAEGTGEEALLRRQTGDLLRYGALAAWDEGGRILPAWMEPTERGLRLVVDDAGAFGTITVDPLLNLAWTAESDQAIALFGYSVASAGDVNGDGYDDVVVGAVFFDDGQSNEGRVYLYLGSALGLETTAAWRAESDQIDAFFGASVASAGDVNGDGYDDVIVGAVNYSNGQPTEGRAYLYLGSAAGLELTHAWTAEGDQSSAAFGISVASAGDVNGDGYDDVVVGASAYENGELDEGRAYLFLGTAIGLEAVAAWTAEPDQLAYFGGSVAAAGDVNGDGYADVIVGAWGFENGEGGAFLYQGSAAGLEVSAAWIAEGGQWSGGFANSVASAGDVDGDGYDDVVVGASLHDNTEADEGQAFLYRGSAAGLELTAAWTAQSGQEDAHLGTSVASAGDVNGDGYADVVVGAPDFDNGQFDEGSVSLYLGSAAGLESASALTFEADLTDAQFGWSVATAGDVNGDGYDDLLMGAPYFHQGEGAEGAAYLYLGGCDSDGDGSCDPVDPCPADPLDDADSDGVCGDTDVCPGFDDLLDADADARPDGCDACPGFDDALDADGDRTPDACDTCAGFDDSLDADSDGFIDGCDGCPTVPEAFQADADLDGSGDACDACPGFDDTLDQDGDSFPDDCDICPGFNDASNADGDARPDGCDDCPLDPLDDSDGDGLCDGVDRCPGFNDALDADFDAVPDDCDRCPLDLFDDSDGDGSCDSADLCPGWNDRADADADAVPDDCDACPADPLDDSDGDGRCDSVDLCPGFDDAADADADAVPDGCDPCPVDPQDDTDGDGSCDSADLCPGFNDAENADSDAAPDDCDPCPVDPLDDSDGDGSCDSADLCPGFDDAIDGDADAVPDGCDPCPLDPLDDSDSDGSCDSIDLCATFDDTLDVDADGIPNGCDTCDAGPAEACIPAENPPAGTTESEGCGCNTPSTSTGWWVLGLLALVSRRSTGRG